MNYLFKYFLYKYIYYTIIKNCITAKNKIKILMNIVKNKNYF